MSDILRQLNNASGSETIHGQLLADAADLIGKLNNIVDEWTEIEAMNILMPETIEDWETHEQAKAAFGYCAVQLLTALRTA